MVNRDGCVSIWWRPQGRGVEGAGRNGAAVDAQEDHGLEPRERVREAQSMLLQRAIEIAKDLSRGAHFPMPIRRERSTRSLRLKPGERSPVRVHADRSPPGSNGRRSPSIDLKFAKASLQRGKGERRRRQPEQSDKRVAVGIVGRKAPRPTQGAGGRNIGGERIEKPTNLLGLGVIGGRATQDVSRQRQPRGIHRRAIHREPETLREVGVQVPSRSPWERRKPRRRIHRRPRPVGCFEATGIESDAKAGRRRTLRAKCIGRRGGGGSHHRVVRGVQQGTQVPRDYHERPELRRRGVGHEGLDETEQEVNSMMTARPASSWGHVESAESIGESGAISGGPRRGAEGAVSRRKSGRRAGRGTSVVRRRP